MVLDICPLKSPTKIKTACLLSQSRFEETLNISTVYVCELNTNVKKIGMAIKPFLESHVF